MSVVITLSSDEEEKIKPARNNSLKMIKKESRHKKPCPKEDVLDERNLALFKKFLEFCTEIEVRKRGGSPRSMKQINEKLLTRFNDADPEYTKSEAFKNSLSAATKMVENDPSNLFVHMKQVVDELKARNVKKVKASKRKVSESEGEKTSKRVKEEDESSKVETSSDKMINERHVKKLEFIFQKVYRKVKKLEEQEVDWDDDEDSAYIRLERYKKRLYLIWEKWQEVRGHKGEIKRLKTKVAFSGTNYPKLNYAIESYVNKNQNFPDFFDILKLTTDTLCPEGEKAIPQDELQKIASAAFQNLGNQLQKRRVFDFWNSCLSYLPTVSTDDTDIGDPADKDNNLAKVLEENHNQHQKKMNEVINKFVEQQVIEKLEPQEVLPGMEDEDSKSEEEEEEEEEPEDVIALSSSSEGSDAEVEECGVRENGISSANHYENGNLEELKSEDIHKNGDENEVHDEKMDSLKRKDKKSSSVSVVKSKPKPAKEESIATSSSVEKNEAVNVKSEEKHGKMMNNETDCDIVVLSGSDMEQ